jgi:hypothetical protein
VRLDLLEANRAPGVRQHFWDVQIGGNTVVVGAPTCPTCGAPLAHGALVCSYCHTDTRSAAEKLFLVVKLERLN